MENQPAQPNISVTVRSGGVGSKIAGFGGVVAIAAVGLHYFGGDIAKQEIDQSETSISVLVEEVQPINIECFVAAKPVIESNVRTKLAVAGKKIGPTGYKAAFDAAATSYVCFDGAFIETVVNQETKEQVVTIDRAGKQVITEYDSISLNTDVEGALAETGDFLAGIGDVFGLDGGKDAINETKAELGTLLEKESKKALEGRCLSQLDTELEKLVVQGVYLQARNQNIDPNTVTVVFEGDKPLISQVDFALEAGKLGFDVDEETVKDINCEAAPDAFTNVDQLTQPALTAEDKQTARKDI